MRELDSDIGKVYSKDGYYYLEKVFNNLGDLIDDEKNIKAKAKRGGFQVMDSSWEIEENPYYYVARIITNNNVSKADKIRFIFKIKLEYLK